MTKQEWKRRAKELRRERNKAQEDWRKWITLSCIGHAEKNALIAQLKATSRRKQELLEQAETARDNLAEQLRSALASWLDTLEWWISHSARPFAAKFLEQGKQKEEAHDDD